MRIVVLVVPLVLESLFWTGAITTTAPAPPQPGLPREPPSNITDALTTMGVSAVPLGGKAAFFRGLGGESSVIVSVLFGFGRLVPLDMEASCWLEGSPLGALLVECRRAAWWRTKASASCCVRNDLNLAPANRFTWGVFLFWVEVVQLDTKVFEAHGCMVSDGKIFVPPVLFLSSGLSPAVRTRPSCQRRPFFSPHLLRRTCAWFCPFFGGGCGSGQRLLVDGRVDAIFGW